MESAIDLTTRILTNAQDLVKTGVENADGHTVLEVGLILAIAHLIVVIDNSTGRLVQSMY
jgi:hypothetical protein